LKSSSIVRVRYAETDQMGMVYHSNFLVYFEIGRTDYLRELGFTYRKMEEDHVYMPVTECHCRFHLPAVYDDELTIQTNLELLSRLKLRFNYEVIRKADSKLIAEGYTVHVPINQDGKPCRVPSIYLAALQGKGTNK
jgi:acyl-CoA thioester hydrolase